MWEMTWIKTSIGLVAVKEKTGLNSLCLNGPPFQKLLQAFIVLQEGGPASPPHTGTADKRARRRQRRNFSTVLLQNV